MRLIDADAMFDENHCYTTFNKNLDYCDDSDIAEWIDKQPTVDANPVRHGEWIVQKVDVNQTKFYCSECERTVLCGNDYFMKPSEYVAKIYPYCHCGAKMHKGAQND